MLPLPRKRPSFLAVLLLGGFGWSLLVRAGVPGSTLPTLAESDTRAIDSALEGKTPGPAIQNVYAKTTATATNMLANAFVRNTNLWIGSNVDLTAISAYNNNVGSYGTKFPITAISPIHCLGAAHVNLKPGTELNFVGVDNQTATRTVMSSMVAADDIDVYLLDSELPRNITPMKILPADWGKYIQLGDDFDTPPIPVIFVNQANRLYCAEAPRVQHHRHLGRQLLSPNAPRPRRAGHFLALAFRRLRRRAAGSVSIRRHQRRHAHPLGQGQPLHRLPAPDARSPRFCEGPVTAVPGRQNPLPPSAKVRPPAHCGPQDKILFIR
jgi:hypothetical protein